MFFEGGGGVPPFVCTWGRWFLDYAYSLPLFFFQWQLIGEESEIMQQPWPPQSKQGFWYLFPWGKSPKVSVLEPESSCRRHDSTSFLEKVIFQKFEHTTPPEPRYLTTAELNDPRPARNGSGGPKERPRPHGHTISGHGKKPWRHFEQKIG